MIEIKNFSKIYPNGKVGADDLTLIVDDGDIFAFIGHNGAGKTTTIKSIVGILDITKGDILINGISIKSNPVETKKIMAYVPDNPDIYNALTGIQYLNLIADIYRVDKTVREKLIKKYATDYEIIDNLNDAIANYSHGMKQKLVLISALIHEPKVLILDEPFVGLDPKSTFLTKQIMKDLSAKKCTIFFSTHILEVAEKLCNKVAIIKNGKIITCGKMSDVKKDKSLESVFMEEV